jgi:hypothetical protein
MPCTTAGSRSAAQTSAWLASPMSAAAATRPPPRRPRSRARRLTPPAPPDTAARRPTTPPTPIPPSRPRPRGRKEPITTGGVKHVLTLDCQGPETAHVSRRRPREASLYDFKGGGLRPPPAPLRAAASGRPRRRLHVRWAVGATSSKPRSRLRRSRGGCAAHSVVPALRRGVSGPPRDYCWLTTATAAPPGVAIPAGAARFLACSSAQRPIRSQSWVRVEAKLWQWAELRRTYRVTSGLRG